MKVTTTVPLYIKISHDVAQRITNGELPVGKRLYGRSMMASEYSTSPETIRRALKLLSDMKVVRIEPQRGVIVISKDNAARYLQNCKSGENALQLRSDIQGLMGQIENLYQDLTDKVDELLSRRVSYIAAKDPLPNYEVRVPGSSALIGKNIGQMKFWQQTECTIIAIRRGKNRIISPGPSAEIYPDDVLIVVGEPDAVGRALLFVERGTTEDDRI
jgi:K+/H+ antiporter YhaU regulatory subunit KhtT